jgi:hypothetical protein
MSDQEREKPSEETEGSPTGLIFVMLGLLVAVTALYLFMK